MAERAALIQGLRAPKAAIAHERSIALTDTFISKAAASSALGVGMTTLDQLLLGRTIASIKLGSRRLVSLRSLNSYIEQLLASNGAT